MCSLKIVKIILLGDIRSVYFLRNLIILRNNLNCLLTSASNEHGLSDIEIYLIPEIRKYADYNFKPRFLISLNLSSYKVYYKINHRVL